MHLKRMQMETIRSNVIGCLNLADVTSQKGIHMTYYGTGCIFHYDDDFPQGSGKGFKEADKPNFTGSYYSYTKVCLVVQQQQLTAAAAAARYKPQGQQRTAKGGCLPLPQPLKQGPQPGTRVLCSVLISALLLAAAACHACRPWWRAY